MAAERPNKEDIFNTAAETTDAAERAAFLDEACASDGQLREEIEELLERDRRAAGFLESPPSELGIAPDKPITEKPGDTIGVYILRDHVQPEKSDLQLSTASGTELQGITQRPPVSKSSGSRRALEKLEKKDTVPWASKADDFFAHLTAQLLTL